MAPQTLPRPAPVRDRFALGWRFVRRRNDDGTETTEQVPLTAWDVLHPQEDDFIVNNELHNAICLYLKNVLQWRCRDRSDALVLQDHRVDWQAADLIPHGPDVVLFFNAPPWDRTKGTYRVRDEGADPRLVIEVTSPSTRENDINDKVFDYSAAAIPLYVIVDPYEIEDGRRIILTAYHPSDEGPVLVKQQTPNRVWLEDVGLWLTAIGDRVVFMEKDGTPIPDYTQVAKSLEAEKARAEAAEQRARELEAELRRLRGE